MMEYAMTLYVKWVKGVKWNWIRDQAQTYRSKWIIKDQTYIKTMSYFIHLSLHFSNVMYMVDKGPRPFWNNYICRMYR